MGKRGEIKVVIADPATGVHLRIEGWVTNGSLPTPPTIRLVVDGKELDSFAAPPTKPFVREYDLPNAFDAGHDTTLVIETSATASPPGETRELGFALGAFSWTPHAP
jgi:hypothetical protein